MKAFVLVIASIFFAPVVAAQIVLTTSGPKKIKILSWNIYMLPGIISHDNSRRADVIGEVLANSDYDVIVFQEAFHSKARKIISRLLQPAFPFQSGPANQKFLSLKTNSGIWIFSKYPILDAQSIIFNSRAGIDAMSRKGALLVEIKVDGQPLQIIGTHLQNGSKGDLQNRQCAELYSRLLEKQMHPGIPQIICGDFNVSRHVNVAGYDMMLKLLDVTDGELNGEERFSYDHERNDLGVEPGPGQELIDYIFVRSTLALKTERRIKVLQRSWHPRHRDLSDHYSVEAEVSLPAGSSLETARLLK
jgi:endonuclease/exonuclease/phosphatase family metal-dependent hydrolase